MNPYANYMLVRQSNAHAWTEVWLKGRGWVRIDPTAAIHPSRVEVDLSQAWTQREQIFNDKVPVDWAQYSPGVIENMQLFWDSLNENWQSIVIDFDAGNQNKFFKNLGFPNLSMSDLIHALLVIALIVMSITALFLLRQSTKLDKTAVSFKKLTRKLSAIGFTQQHAEGPVDYIHRIISERPDLQVQLKPILELYLSLRYRESNHRQEQSKQFTKRINSLSL